MLKNFLFLILFACSSTLSIGQDKKVSLSGHIRDETNGEELIGASIYIAELEIGAATNVYGFFSVSIPPGTYSITYSYMGFEPTTQTVELNESKTVNIELKPSSVALQGVDITAEKRDQNITGTEMSSVKVEMEELKKIPALLGEVDIIKSIQLLPGVTSVGEGASGFNVRGGSIDQNLILLDEAPVYNSSHLMGFFSVFNPDAVKSVKLVKGGIPAQFGGRLASLLDVRMKDGNMKQTEVSGGIGVIFSRLTIETPLIKDKSSLIVAARRSYIDVLAKPFLKKDLRDIKFYFYDLTAKANYIVNDNNRLFLSSYLGRDVFDAGAGAAFNWGNATTSLRWNHIFNNKLFLNTTAFYSNYDYSLEFGDPDEENDEGFSWKSNIINYSFKPELTLFANPKNTVKFGMQTIYYQFKPGKADFKSNELVSGIALPNKRALESGIYVSNEQKAGVRISMEYGVRYSMYQYMGKGRSYYFGDAEMPGEIRPLEQIKEHDKGEVIESYGNLEPRFGINYKLNEKSAIKASYNRMAQYIHLISNTTASTPLDVWQPTSNNIKPQIGDQVALGYFRNFKDNAIEASVEVYYKVMKNQIDYIDNANLLLNEYLEGELLNGKGRAFGMELFVRKNRGKLTGWISYTLGRTERQVEGINLDEWFPSRFDKTHNLSVVAMYPINERWSFSANFAFSTGTPATFPTNRVTIGDWAIPHNSEERRNNYRIPAYHRLDFSFTRGMPKASTKRLKSELVLGVYNAYGRKNPFSVYFRPNENSPQVTEAVRYSVIGSVVPAISWNFTFK